MSPISISVRKLVRLLKNNGFIFVRQTGSHAIFKNVTTSRKVTVPVHNKDIPPGTAHAILKDVGISIEGK